MYDQQSQKYASVGQGESSASVKRNDIVAMKHIIRLNNLAAPLSLFFQRKYARGMIYPAWHFVMDGSVVFSGQ